MLTEISILTVHRPESNRTSAPKVGTGTQHSQGEIIQFKYFMVELLLITRLLPPSFTP